MTRDDRPFTTPLACWRCGVAVPRRRVEIESVLRSRSKDEGGPYRVFSCGCGADCGALRNRAGDWLLHPLEGLEEPGFLDRLVPRQGHDAQRAAMDWWLRHRAAVERFRRAPRRAGADAPRPPPPPPPPPRSRTRRKPPGDEPRRRRPPPRDEPRTPPPRVDVDARAPHDLLGVSPDADADTIRRAYRKALKLCHPDRVANLDPEIQEVAHRKAKALRRAYETMLRHRGG